MIRSRDFKNVTAFTAFFVVAAQLTVAFGEERRVDQLFEFEPVYDLSILNTRSQLGGIAKPRYQAVLRPPEAGVIATLHVREGQSVRKGQALLTLDDRLALANVNIAKADLANVGALHLAEIELEKVHKQYKRIQEAFLENAAADFEVEAKRTEFSAAIARREIQRGSQDEANARLELAKAALDRLTLRAPFKGHVVEINATAGNSVDVDEQAITIAALDELEVELYVPIGLFQQIRVGRQYRLDASDPVNRSLLGTAVHVSRILESTSGTFRCVFHIANSNHNLPAGFQVRLTMDQFRTANRSK